MAGKSKCFSQTLFQGFYWPLCIFAFYSSLYSQELELSPVVVTDVFNNLNLSDVLASVSVISRNQIEKSQAATLADLLQGEAGIEFGRNGGIGSTTSFFTRTR